jgi:hypothetical protein
MTKFFAFFLALGLVLGTSSASGQQLAAATEAAAKQAQPADACAATIKALLRDGGVALPIRGVVPYIDKARNDEERMPTLFYQYDYGALGPDPFWDVEIFRKWEKLASGYAWVVVANRSVLPKVQSREWLQAIKTYDWPMSRDTTIWFAVVAAVDETGNCQHMVVYKGAFYEDTDLPAEVWSMLNPTVILPPLEDE